MKYLTALLIAIVGLCISTYGESRSTNIVVEIIEFDCTDHPSLFRELSQEYKQTDPFKGHIPLLNKAKSSKLPREIILRHKQALLCGGEITQSTELNDSKFEIETIHANQPNALNIKLDYSKQFEGTELRDVMRTEIVLLYAKPQTLSLGFETASARSEDGTVVESKKIKSVQISIQITGEPVE